jgi:hypothetical protein
MYKAEILHLCDGRVKFFKSISVFKSYLMQTHPHKLMFRHKENVGLNIKPKSFNLLAVVFRSITGRSPFSPCFSLKKRTGLERRLLVVVAVLSILLLIFLVLIIVLAYKNKSQMG